MHCLAAFGKRYESTHNGGDDNEDDDSMTMTSWDPQSLHLVAGQSNGGIISSYILLHSSNYNADGEIKLLGW